MVAASAGLPYTAACSPKSMTFPGADTMKVGAVEGGIGSSIECVWDCKVDCWELSG